MMKTIIPHKILLVSLVFLQIIGPSWVLALQASNSVDHREAEGQALVAGLGGVVTVNPLDNTKPGFAPKYRTTLSVGDVITTEEDSVAEILLNNSGLFAIQEYSEAVIGQEEDGRLSVDLEVGTAEWSLPTQSSGSLPFTFKTPNIHATTQGGLVTVAVQQTFSQLAAAPIPSPSYLIRTSLQVKTTPVKRTGLLETFCVNEGDLSVEFSELQTTTRQKKVIKTGECLRFLDGQLQVTGDQSSLGNWRAVCAVGKHCEIPESAKKLIAKKQMGQALALERALVGSDGEDSAVDEQVVLATTGQSLGASIEGFGPGDPGAGGVILPTTGDGGGSDPGSGGGGSNPGNIQPIASVTPAGGVSGGWGLLGFADGDFTASQELFLVDSGIVADAPHSGKVPQNTLVISSLTPNGGGNVTNQNVPLQFPSFNQTPSSSVTLGTESDDRFDQAQQLAQFARSSGVDPADILGSVPTGAPGEPCQSPIECFEIYLALGEQGTFQSPGSDGGIDGTIRLRSPSSLDPAAATRDLTTVKGGVVLVNTKVFIDRQDATEGEFLPFASSLGYSVQGLGAAVAVIGTPGNPAGVKFEDRVLAVLGGSSLNPANASVTTGIIGVQDSYLVGPTSPPVIGKDAQGNDIVRSDIPPLIEVIDGEVVTNFGVSVGSTVPAPNDDPFDQALLVASSPLLAMIRGNFTANTEFGLVAGKNAELRANLAGALVSLDASSMVVNGNLFRVTKGGLLNVTGSLLSLTGGSTFSLNGGALVSVEAGSAFTLQNGALVNFGTGTNTVNITNSLCAGGGCFSPFANTSFQVAGNPANFSAPNGFDPFVNLGNLPDGSVNTVNVAPGSAVLAVQGGGRITITP